jgi:hypothetical protein
MFSKPSKHSINPPKKVIYEMVRLRRVRAGCDAVMSIVTHIKNQDLGEHHVIGYTPSFENSPL